MSDQTPQQPQPQQYGAPQYNPAQPPYGTNPYANQGPQAGGYQPAGYHSAGSPSQPLAQPAPSYPTNAPYQQPYPAAPYGQQPPVGFPGYAPAATPQRSPLLGLIGLAVVVVCAVASTVLAAQFGHDYGVILQQLGVTANGQAPDASTMSDSPALRSFVEGQLGRFGTIGTLSLVGIIGWIVSIVATATKRGRALGIIGIILGVIAPFVILMAIGVPMAAMLR